MSMIKGTMMHKVGRVTVVAALLSLTGCGMFGGDGKLAPNEFEVVGRKPLVIPPDSEMRPPRPGEPQAQAIDPGQRALDALFPGRNLKAPPMPSSGETALLRRIGGADGDVRSVVWERDPQVVKKSLLLADILHVEERQFSSDNISVERVSSTQKSGS